MKLWLVIPLFLVLGCGSSEPVREAYQPLESDTPVDDVVVEVPRFVVVSRNSPIFLEPAGDEALRFRTPEEQSRVEEKLRTRAMKSAEKLQKTFAKEIEREKKRMKKMRKAETREEYAAARRKRRAKRYLKSLNRRAKRSKEPPPTKRYIVFRVLDDQGDWLKVQTLTREEENRHCYRGALSELDGLRMNFFVRKSDLEDVVIRRERVGVWRGTEVKLAAGVVVEGDPRVANVDGFRLRLNVADDAVGKDYQAQSHFESPFTDTVFTDIALAEGHLKLDKKQFIPHNPYRDLYVTGTMWVGKRFYATTQTPCGEFTVLTSEEDLEPAGRRGALRLGGEGRKMKPPFISRDTTVFDRNGVEIGTVASQYALGSETAPVQNRRCFKTWVWKKRKKRKDKDRNRMIELCVDSESVQDE